jgi:hypothetical protein
MTDEQSTSAQLNQNIGHKLTASWVKNSQVIIDAIFCSESSPSVIIKSSRAFGILATTETIARVAQTFRGQACNFVLIMISRGYQRLISMIDISCKSLKDRSTGQHSLIESGHM